MKITCRNLGVRRNNTAPRDWTGGKSLELYNNTRWFKTPTICVAQFEKIIAWSEVAFYKGLLPQSSFYLYPIPYVVLPFICTWDLYGPFALVYCIYQEDTIFFMKSGKFLKIVVIFSINFFFRTKNDEILKFNLEKWSLIYLYLKFKSFIRGGNNS